jgi:predicted helicase
VISNGGDDEEKNSPATTNADVFRTFVKAGQRLVEIHVHYEQQPECPLTKVEKAERNSTTGSRK